MAIWTSARTTVGCTVRLKASLTVRVRWTTMNANGGKPIPARVPRRYRFGRCLAERVRGPPIPPRRLARRRPGHHRGADRAFRGQHRLGRPEARGSDVDATRHARWAPSLGRAAWSFEHRTPRRASEEHTSELQ